MHFPILRFIIVSHFGSIVWGFALWVGDLEAAFCLVGEVENGRLLENGDCEVNTANCRVVRTLLGIIV